MDPNDSNENIEHGPISKGLNTNSVAEHCETLKGQACRDTPTLLNYIPSYKGVLRKKEKRKDGESTNKKKMAPSDNQGAQKGQKRPRVRLPTYRKSTAYWFSPTKPSDVEEPILPGFNVPLQTVIHCSAGHPNLCFRPGSVRGASGVSKREEAEISHDIAPPSPRKPRTVMTLRRMSLSLSFTWKRPSRR
ncbi:hypothetical protein RHGRI_034218 [Rhododendron griersonianum]|uniref:Uncharacterized protein n=1 Tax=Rhododendron griersonianum TaxID=479676 RepID=A0AAV6HZM9_9ERIC|nr:hypothetical protein RHGRI_034218 [Rhododendron griersonianum]